MKLRITLIFGDSQIASTFSAFVFNYFQRRLLTVEQPRKLKILSLSSSAQSCWRVEPIQQSCCRWSYKCILTNRIVGIVWNVLQNTIFWSGVRWGFDLLFCYSREVAVGIRRLSVQCIFEVRKCTFLYFTSLGWKGGKVVVQISSTTTFWYWKVGQWGVLPSSVITSSMYYSFRHKNTDQKCIWPLRPLKSWPQWPQPQQR